MRHPTARFVLAVSALVLLACVGSLLAQTVPDPPLPTCEGCGAKATRDSSGRLTIVHKEGCPYGPRPEGSSGDPGGGHRGAPGQARRVSLRTR